MGAMKTVLIGDVAITAPAVMAPIAGMTDGPFRRLVMENGAGLVVSELISANALIQKNQKTVKMLPAKDEPGPVAVQIFGGDLSVIKDAAKIVEDQGRADIIDLNFGCPVKKVTKCGAGAAALKDISKIEKVVLAVVSAVDKPVTAKIRIGWDQKSVNAVDVARAVESAGASAIVVHGRTASQGYGGEADWDVIADVARAVKIPVIGNGDITTPTEALSRLKTSGCDLVMIGRGALGAPWVFSQINQLCADSAYTSLSNEEKTKTALCHFDMMVDWYGGERGVKKMRAHLGYYTRGMKGAARFRDEINHTPKADEARSLIASFFQSQTEIEEPAGL